jgi:NADPH:quinone reductase-like Zn-dependent oxidoreductase
MPKTIPHTMRALVLDHYHDDLSAAIAGLKVVERPVPALCRGQVLVKMKAAPCNPSDLLLLQGKYGNLKTLPSVPGWEGTGEVISAGGGWLARWLVGKRVACGLQEDRDGTWAEYFVANASECIPLKQKVPSDQAASLIINPLTAMGLLDTARRHGHRAAVHTAAASQLGRMLLAMAKRSDYPIIHVVRRDAQFALLKSLGAEHVLNSSADDFAQQLRADCAQLGATAAFEAIGGEITGSIISAMPPGSTAYVYGALSGDPCSDIDPIELIFQEKSVSGFYLGTWLRRRGMLAILRAAGRVQRMLIDGSLHTKVQRRLTLDEAVDGLGQYLENMTEGKVLIMPHET